ncbi:MAG: hypothetical protein KBS72_06220 [Bacteroidales bacterium]|nr:hypothetical protein [Candidatus Cacconaster scatequi]
MVETDAVAMEEKLRTLYKIQLTDSKIDKIHLLRGELPLEVQDLEDEIAGLQTRIANAEDEIRKFEKANAESRTTIENAKEAIAKYEEQRNNVKNNREYDSLTKEIEFQDLDQQVCLKRIKENDICILERKETVENARNLLELRTSDLEEKKKELETIVEETAKEEETLLKEKEALAAKVDQRMLVAYDRVRSNAHNHLAVVTVKRDACGGCFNKIPPQKQLDIKENKKIIVCEYCGRILVSSDFEQE